MANSRSLSPSPLPQRRPSRVTATEPQTMASSPGMSARDTSSDQRSPRDKLAAASILSGGIRRGSSFLKPPRNLGVGTKTVMPRRSASARSGRCGESGLTLMAVALFHGSMSRSRAAATSAPAKFGIRPCGGNGKRATPSALLAAEGIRYVCDWGNDEQPHRMTPKTGELHSLGVNAYLDDNYIHLHGRRTIKEVILLWREWFDGLYADGATTGRLMVLHLHPWIMGQPWRIRHLDEVLGHITAYQGVWKATGSEIIDWFKAQSGS